MPYWRLHYHFVWATFNRLPLLSDELMPHVQRSIYSRAKRLGVIVHALGGVEDHIHVVASVPPKLALAECVGQLKGSSSHIANEVSGESRFGWGEGYGAVSLSEGSLPKVIEYVRNQREHHSGGSLLEALENVGDNHGKDPK